MACRDAQLHMHLMARKLLDDIGEDWWKTDHVTPLPGSQQELEELQTLMETMKSGSAGIIHFPADCSNKLIIVTFNEEKEICDGHVLYHPDRFLQRLKATREAQKQNGSSDLREKAAPPSYLGECGRSQAIFAMWPFTSSHPQ